MTNTKAGIDFEPNFVSDSVQNIILDDLNADYKQGFDFTLTFTNPFTQQTMHGTMKEYNQIVTEFNKQRHHEAAIFLLKELYDIDYDQFIK